jgi:hypothetical protein
VRVCNDATKYGEAAEVREYLDWLNLSLTRLEVPFAYVAERDPVWVDPAAHLLAPSPLVPGEALPAAGTAPPLPPRGARPFYDLGRENLAGRNWTLDGSEFMFGMTSDAPGSLTGSFGEFNQLEDRMDLFEFK